MTARPTRLSCIFLAAAFGLPVPGVMSAGNSEVHPGTADQAVQASTTDPTQQIPHTLKALSEAKAGEYGDLRAEDRQLLDKADRDIHLLMRKYNDLGVLDPQEKVQLFNAQETVLGVVSGLKRTQLVCTYRAEAGTRLKTKHCVTRDMADAQKRGAKDATHSWQNPLCSPGEGNPCE